jgi:hypothetical protein
VSIPCNDIVGGGVICRIIGALAGSDVTAAAAVDPLLAAGVAPELLAEEVADSAGVPITSWQSDCKVCNNCKKADSWPAACKRTPLALSLNAKADSTRTTISRTCRRSSSRIHAFNCISAGPFITAATTEAAFD